MRQSKRIAQPVYLELTQVLNNKRRRKKLKTGITVSSPSQWNQKRQMIIKSAPSAEEKNEFLRKYLQKMESLRMKLELEHDYVNIDMLLDGLNPKQNSDSFLEYARRKIADNYLLTLTSKKTYTFIFNKLARFKPSITFSQMEDLERMKLHQAISSESIRFLQTQFPAIQHEIITFLSLLALCGPCLFILSKRPASTKQKH